MKKRSFPKANNIFSKKEAAASGVKKVKKVPVAPAAIDDKIVVKKITMKIGWISEDLKSIGLDCLFTYANDIDKIQSDLMNEAIQAQDAARKMRGPVAEKYQKKKKHGDDDDDDNNEQQEEEEQPANYDDSSSDSSSDSEEDEDDQGPDELAVLVKDKKNITTKFRLFTKAYMVPIHSIYAEFTCIVVDGNSGKYPPLFDDLKIVKVVNKYESKAMLVSKVMKDIVKTAPWSTVDMRTSIAASEVRNSVASKMLLISIDMIFDYIKKKELQKMASVLLRDTFRSAEFYWMACYFSVQHTLTDEKAVEVYKDIANGQLLEYAFTKFDPPLEVANFIKSVKTQQLTGLIKEDTATMIEMYNKEDDESNDVDSMIEANRIWVFLRKNIALYQGRLLWHLTGYDVERMAPPPQATGSEYLIANNHALRHPLDENIIIPYYAIYHWGAFIKLVTEKDKYVNVSCFEQISSSKESLQSLFTAIVEPDSTIAFCPTNQSREHAIASTPNMTAICAESVQTGEDKWIQNAIDNKKFTILLYETHLFSIRQMSMCLASIFKFIVKLISIKNRAKIKLVLCGVNTEPVFNEVQTHNAAAHDLFDSSALKNGELSKLEIGTVDGLATRLTTSVLESAVDETVNIINNKNLTIIEMTTVCPKQTDLTQEEASTVASYISEILERNKERKTCFLFENNAHMKQIVSLSEYSSNRCSAFFNTHKINVGETFTEPDGGCRRIIDLEIQSQSSTSGGPAFGSSQKRVNNIDLSNTPVELVYYSMKQGIKRGFKRNPLTNAHFACISKCRFSPQPDMDYVAIFTLPEKKYNQSDMNFLNYLANDNVFILTVPKKTGYELRPISSKNNINFFDLAYTTFCQDNEKN